MLDTYNDDKLGWATYIVEAADKNMLKQMAIYLFIDNGEDLKTKIQNNLWRVLASVRK